MALLPQHLGSVFTGSSKNRSKDVNKCGIQPATPSSPAVRAASATMRLERSESALRRISSVPAATPAARSCRNWSMRSSSFPLAKLSRQREPNALCPILPYGCVDIQISHRNSRRILLVQDPQGLANDGVVYDAEP